MNVSEEEFLRLREIYNSKNNEFKPKVIYRVGESQGFHSEVDAMMQCMLWCYRRGIRFTLYADGANFAGGHGWQEFFVPFCEENHDKRNEHVNRRHRINWKHPLWKLDALIFKKIYHAKYLTQDVFFPCINREKAEEVEWKELGINSYDDFGKLAALALRYNAKTENEIEKRIAALNLPDEYLSVQIRLGDKSIEFKNLMTPQDVVDAVRDNNIECKNLFVFTDDYRAIIELKKLLPDFNIYTLTREDEMGYDNVKFQAMDWEYKKENTLKMFAMIEICLKSKIHLGCGQSCTNSYIHSVKDKEGYLEIFNDREQAHKWTNYK